MSYSHATFRSASAMIGNWTFVWLTSLISLIHLSWEPRSLALYITSASTPQARVAPFVREEEGKYTSPIILTPLLSNSPPIFANAPSSVVHTGVKSAGCENRIAQLLPMNWWKSISPWVVLAVKLGATPRQLVFTSLIGSSVVGKGIGYRLNPVADEAVPMPWLGSAGLEVAPGEKTPGS